MAAAGGRVASALSVRCMRSWRPFCCGLPGSISCGMTPSRTHHADSLDSRASVLVANGTPLSVRMYCGRPYSWNRRWNTGFAPATVVSGDRGTEQEAAVAIGDGERIAVPAVAHPELALEVRAPDMVRRHDQRGGLAGMADLAPARFVTHQSAALEQRAGRRAARQLPRGVAPGQVGEQLPGAPGRMAMAQRHQRVDHRRLVALGAVRGLRERSSRPAGPRRMKRSIHL